jgi:eukaryotic-like serine/threonine-protein kinase
MTDENEPHKPPPESVSGTDLFGQIAESMGLLSHAQVRKALQIQTEREINDEAHLRIGEILIERHDLELRAVHKVLLEQKRRRTSTHQDLDSRALKVRMIGGYSIEEVIGTGGMGTVYKAQDVKLRRTVALKILAPRLTEDAEFVARFEREVTAVGSLSHPNIVAALSSGRDEDRPYMVMEYVAGQSLGKILRESGRLPERRALEIARDVARALDHAHSRGVVHRDVKPDNVIVATNGVAKLTDFGLAKLLREDHRLTQTGIALGTPHYISPEQVSASRYIDHRADQYSLGAVLFHMLAGQVPFDGPTNNDIMLRHLEDELHDPCDLAPGVSVGSVRIIYKLMAKKSANRYDATSLLVEDIDRVLAGREPAHAPPVDKQRAEKLHPRSSGCATSVILLIVLLCIIDWIGR